MAKSSVFIELTSNPLDGETFIIYSDITTDIEITFKDIPILLGEVGISINTLKTLNNLLIGINSFYNGLNEYTLTLESSSQMKVEAAIDNVVFTKDESGLTNGVLTITNEEVAVPIVIESAELYEFSGDCDNATFDIITNIDFDEYSINGASRVVITPTSRKFISLPRESVIEIEVFDTTQSPESSDTITVTTPLKLVNLYKYVTWSSVCFPEYCTLTIHLDENPPYPYFANGNQYQYQLGIGEPWQYSNVFTGLSEGYQPSLGFREFSEDVICTQDDQINEIFIDGEELNSITEPYFEISESNSLIFEYEEEYNNKSVYKNNFNSKSCQSETQISESITQYFNSSDIVKTQIQTNYENTNVFVTKQNGDVVNFPTYLMVQNIGLLDSRDAKFYSINSNEIGLYFTSGNTYNYETGDVTGTYTLDGYLPSWAVVGNYVLIYELGGYLEIKNIIYSDEKSADVLVFDYIYNESELDTRVSCKYNKEQYNVYGFDVTMINIKDEVCNIRIDNTDERDNWIDLGLISEDIYSMWYPKDTIEFIYFNYNNTSDMYYKDLDFYNLLRLEYDTFSDGIDNELEIEKTDNTSISLSTRNYHLKLLSLKSIPTQYMRKITQAFSHKEIFLNRIQYTVESIEVSEVIGSTNTYGVEIKLIAAENGYNPLLNREYVGNIRIYETLESVFVVEDGSGKIIQDGNDKLLTTG